MICKNLVEINHGTINVFSYGINRGTVIEFTMKMSLGRSVIEEEVKTNRNLDDSSVGLIAEKAEEATPIKSLDSKNHEQQDQWLLAKKPQRAASTFIES